LEKHPHGHHHSQHSSSRHGSVSLSEKDALHRGQRRRTGLEADSNQSRSRQSSRSSTPHLDPEGGEKPLSERVRRGSSVSSTASVRRKTKDRKDRDGTLGAAGTPAGLSPLTLTSASGEDDREERRRRRREKEAAKEKERDRENGASAPTTPRTETPVIKSEPA